MKNYIKFVILLFVAVTLGFTIKSNEPFIEQLKLLLDDYNHQYPREKIYVQTDKTFYKPGEDIWFNLFLVNATDHRPSDVSDVVYVELLDPKGNVAFKQTLHTKQGVSKGDFHLEESAAGGMYKLTAYTQWMKNFGEEDAFTKELQVQKIITPRLLMKLDFEKEAYGAGDEVTAKLRVKNLENEVLRNGAIEYKVLLQSKVVIQSKVSLQGDEEINLRFTLPEDLSSTDGLFNAIVMSDGISESISRSVPIVLNKIDLQFFPEGGDLVEGVSTSVAFKVLNEFGKAADISGVIRDDEDRVVQRFESYHMGMGVFDFTPESGKKYHALITKPQGISKHYFLPEAAKSGYRFGVELQHKDGIDFKVYAPTNEACYIVGQTGGVIYAAEKILLNAGDNDVTINTKDFPPGIAVFTLFSGDGLEQSERLVFVNKNKGLRMSMETDKDHYLPREKVDVKIKTVDNEGRPVPASLSMSVVDDQLISFADDKQDNILSWLLMSSELKGDVQEPSFYFNDDEPKADRALDYLMMTQGWRRFTWKDIRQPDQSITLAAEKTGNLSGLVRNRRTRETREMEVTLFELNNKRRMIKLETTTDGRFTFYNIDPTSTMMLMSRIPFKNMDNWEIVVDNAQVGRRYSSSRGVSVVKDVDKFVEAIPTAIKEEVREITKPQVAAVQPTSDPVAFAGGDIDVSLDEDVQQLSEIVTVGYGTSKSSSLTGCVVVIDEYEINNNFSMFSVNELLQGRVAGVQVQSQSGSPGDASTVRIRGVSSILSGNSQPLYVVDGVPISPALTGTFGSPGFVDVNDIESITVLRSAEASSLYGSQAANGAIIIESKRKLVNRRYANYDIDRNRFASLTIQPRIYSTTREFYAPVYKSLDKDEERSDFRTTVYWNPLIVTNEKGEATVSFYNNDATTAFRITAEGIGHGGKIGRKEIVYHTLIPFSIDTKIPEFITFEDTVRVPVMVKNATEDVLSTNVEIDVPNELRVVGSVKRNVSVKPQSTETIWVTLLPRSIAGTFPVSVSLSGGGYSDVVKRTVQVQSVGFPTSASFSAKALDKTISFNVSDPEGGSLRAEFVAYPDILSDLAEGVESMLREPYGCFEQTSSITFPNILVLQFMKEAGTVNDVIEKRALSLIDKGYKRLKGFEVRGGGFDWFGNPPANEGLTAYGLLEFMEMKKVYDGVSEPMIERTREWLLKRRRGNGTFIRDDRRYDHDVIDAYIVYALTETGITHEIEREFRHALRGALDKKDFYRMALIANAAYEMNDKYVYTMLVDKFRTEVNEVGYDNLKAEKSFTYSYGKSLQVEIVSLWALAMMKDPSCDLKAVSNMIDYLITKRAQGGFGSTQGTIMALRALTAYAKHTRKMKEDGEIELYVNNTLAGTVSYEKDSKGRLVIDNLEKYLTAGSQNLRVVYKGATEALPYSINAQWNSKTPGSSGDCKVRVSTVLSENQVKVNETVRLTIRLQNNTSEMLPMSMAIVGIPAGLSAQPWQLKELQEKKVFDFYEVRDNYLVLYYRGMDPSERRDINLDLKAEIPGTYLSPASSGYLYYASEFKHWVPGNRVTVLN